MVSSAILSMLSMICPIERDFSDRTSIAEITFIVISDVFLALSVKFCIEVMPSSMEAPVESVKALISSVPVVTSCILLDKVSICDIQSAELVSRWDAPDSISEMAL